MACVVYADFRVILIVMINVDYADFSVFIMLSVDYVDCHI